MGRLNFDFVLRTWLASLCCVLTSSAMAQEAGSGNVLLSAVPDDCYAMSWWDSSQPAPEGSQNSTDQLFAEPEVRAFVEALVQGMKQATAQSAPRDKRRNVETAVEGVINCLRKGAGCVFLGDLQIGPDGPENLEAVLVIDCGQSAEKVHSAIIGILDAEAPDIGNETIGGIKFRKYPAGEFPVDGIFVGLDSTRIVAGAGHQAVEDALGRMKAGKIAPQMAALQKRFQSSRQTGLGFVNVRRIRETGMALASPEVAGIIQSLGLGNLDSIQSSTGYSETASFNRTLVKFDGPPSGLFAALGGKGIEAADVGHIPADSIFAAALSVDPGRIVEELEKQLTAISPREAEQMLEELERFREETGVDAVSDLIGQIGPTVTIYNGASDGWLTGITLTAELRDAARFEKAIERLVELARREGGPGAPRFRNWSAGNARLITLLLPREGGAVEPTLCIEGNRLIFAMYPQPVMSAIGGQQMPALLQAEQIASLQKSFGNSGDSRLLGMVWQDTPRLFEFIYPLLQVSMAMRNVMTEEMPGDMRETLETAFGDLVLPPGRTIARHLVPGVVVVRQVADGFEIESQNTLPMMDFTTAAPVGVALLLPAVQSVRQAARRTQSMNNLKQFALAMHNFESAYQKFPSGYGPGVERGPPVSWRVKILPFIEQQALYDMYRFDEPWDSENNQKLLSMMPALFRSPLSNSSPEMTTYLAVGGSDGIFGKEENGQPRTCRMADVMDGTSNTLFLIEAGDSLAVPWTQPDEGVDHDNFDLFSLSASGIPGVLAARADGSVTMLPLSIEPEHFKWMLQMNDGNIIPHYGD